MERVGTVRNFLFLGDTHGDIDFAEKAMHLAAEHTAEIIQVGDWGFLWPSNNQIPYLSELLVRYGVTMRFIDGNHDYFPGLAKYIAGRSLKEAVPFADNLIYQPRGSTHTDEDGIRFLFLGGAPSIDRWVRTPGRSWWPEEFITEDEYTRALNAKGPFDVFVTHDAPDYPPDFEPRGSPGFRAQSRDSMSKIAKVICKHKMPLHVHGHWHDRYSIVNKHPGALLGQDLDEVTKTVGLDCNFASFNDAVMLWSKT